MTERGVASAASHLFVDRTFLSVGRESPDWVVDSLPRRQLRVGLRDLFVEEILRIQVLHFPVSRDEDSGFDHACYARVFRLGWRLRHYRNRPL